MTNLEFVGPVVGTVKLETKWTATCMAIGCPQSQPYTQISLVNAKIDGYRSTVSQIILVEENERLQSLTPNYVIVNGTRIKNGQKVKVIGKSFLRIYNLGMSPTVYATITEIESVKLVR
jgi:hypothetical protein